MNNDEYLKKYINQNAPVSDPCESIIIDNFLTDDEINQFIEASQHKNIYYVHDVSMGPIIKQHNISDDPTTAHYWIFSDFYTNPSWRHLVDIIQPKLEQHFGKLYASHIHVLDSRFPYGIHNDAEQANLELAPEPAWTLIIPLEDYDSKTYVFNERGTNKDPWGWVHANNIQSNETPGVDYDTWKLDFEPFTGYDILDYLTVETTFQWKKGSCFAADRYKYHCSDNYYNRGIKGKRAIIIWTSK